MSRKPPSGDCLRYSRKIAPKTGQRQQPRNTQVPLNTAASTVY